MLEKYTITVEDLLLRRFPVINEPKFIPFFKEINGQYQPTSAAFKTKPNENGLSVNIKPLTPDIASFIGDTQSYKVAEFSAAIALIEGYKCEHDPIVTKEMNNPGHALIIGNTEKIAKKISKNCKVL